MCQIKPEVLMSSLYLDMYSLSSLSALWERIQQDAQPNGPHASPLRQQTLQMPILPEQVHTEGEPHQTHEG